MKVLRILIFLCLGALAWWGLRVAHGYPVMQKIERYWIGWLIANSQAELRHNEPPVASPVVLLRLDDPERKVFDTWPPSAVDWAVLADHLASAEPEVLVVESPLRWSDAATEGVTALGQRLMQIPHVVLACESASDEATFPAELPARYLIAVGRGDTSPPFGLTDKEKIIGIIAPHPEIAPSGVAAFQEPVSTHSGFPAYPMVGWDSSTIYPSAVLEAVLRYYGSTADSTSFRLGVGGSGVFLNEKRFVSTGPDGRLLLDPTLREKIPQLNAAAFLAGASGDLLLSEGDTPGLVKADLKGKILVIGRDDPDSRVFPLPDGTKISRAERLALALATVDQFQELKQLPEYAPWIVAALLGFIICWWRGRSLGQILFRSALMVLVFVVGSLLWFQSNLQWMAPLPPLAGCMAGFLACLFVPARRLVPVEPPLDDPL
jgi:hypothetical protein